MRLVVLPSHFDGDGYYRVLFPAQQLAKHGWQVGLAPHATARLDTKRVNVMYGQWARDPAGKPVVRQSIFDWLIDHPFDVLLMQQREEPEWANVIPALQQQGKRVYVDSDDAWVGLPSWNPGSKKPRASVAAMFAQIAAADGLSVATPALADMYREAQPNIRVIRNRLDWGMWADVTPVYERQSRRLRVGWMGDTKWRAGDLRVLRGVLGPWLERNPDVEFVASGDPRTHDLLGVPVSQRVSVADVQFRNLDLADITAVFDIGLVPLDLSLKARTLNECKSHLKGLEYNACGIPFIASPSESYRWYIDCWGGQGVLASTPAEWRNQLDATVEWLGRRWFLDDMRGCAEMHSIQHGVGEWEDWLGADRSPDPHPAVAAVAA